MKKIKNINFGYISYLAANSHSTELRSEFEQQKNLATDRKTKGFDMEI